MDYLKIVGSHGTKTPDGGTTCLQVAENVLIDAGNIISGLGEEAKKIQHIFLTHSHIDHIVDLPFMLDLYYADQTHTLHIHALPETLQIIRSSLFNFDLYPDFSQINLLNSEHKAVEFHEIEPFEHYTIGEITLMPFPTHHTVPSCGYVIKKEEQGIMFTADTGPSPVIWDILNEDETIHTLITEVSFPSYYEKLATESLHFTPRLLSEDIEFLDRDDVRVCIMHLKPGFGKMIEEEIGIYDLLRNGGEILQDGSIISYRFEPLGKRAMSLSQQFDTLLQTGIALSSERSHRRLTEHILETAKSLTQADGGTLYVLDEANQQLVFKVLHNDTMGIKMGGMNSMENWKPLALYDENGKENHTLVAAHCALKKTLVNIPDVYKAVFFDFRNTKLYDEKSGYRSKSMLVVPLLDHERQLMGVLQLINKKDASGMVVAFDAQDERVISALGAQAAVSMNNQKLITDLETLFESFLDSINFALDEKSPYTAGHIGRMVDLSVMMAHGVHEDWIFFPDKAYDKEQLNVIRLSSLMHDIGKITTPEHIMDKSTKLETIFDRIHYLRMKFEVLKRDLKIAALEAGEAVDMAQLDTLDADFAFLAEANIGGEYFSDEAIARVRRIAAHTFELGGEQVALIDGDELENLIVQKGTLTYEQRQVINNHAAVSLTMLRSISFPKKYKAVPEIAGGHHEKINGKGYPLGLKGDEISFEARILAIADIFEALTAADRPYKPAKKLSEAMKILWFMAKDNDLDRTLCRFFYESGLYLEFARKHLKPFQIDEVDLDFRFDDQA